jgi:enamine deaminase RidA (YjgF/YER057c/UK114 family)
MRRFLAAVTVLSIAAFAISLSGCGTNEAKVRQIAREEAAKVAFGDSLEKFGFGASWEKEFSYAQGVRAGNLIFIAGQLAHGRTVDESGMPTEFFMGDFEQQFRATLENVKAVLANYGATMDDVVFLQNFVVPKTRSGKNLGDYNPIAAKLITEYFPKGLHAMTFAEVQGLYGNDQLVESNAIAVLRTPKE